MPQIYTCPRGHRWEGDVKSSATNPRTRVICPTCGLLALTPVRPNEAQPANPPAAAGRLEDTLMEPLSKMLERAGSSPADKTLPDLSIESLRAAAEAAGLRQEGAAEKAGGQPAKRAQSENAPPQKPAVSDVGKDRPDR